MIIHNYQVVSEIADYQFIHFGYGIFSTFLPSCSTELLKKHYSRIKKGSEFLNISWSLTEVEFIQLINRYQEDLAINECFKIINTESGWYLLTRKFNPKISCKLTTTNYQHYSKNQYLAYKTGNYLPNHHQVLRAKAEGYDDVIICNQDNYICETTKANIFWVIDEELYTPALSCGLLNGTIRQIICENFNVTQITNMTLKQLAQVDCVFITNALNPLVIVENWGNAVECKIIEKINRLIK